MSKVFVSDFKENGIAKWGLFYEDGKGVRKHLTEDFKPLVFESENEAQRKLYLSKQSAIVRILQFRSHWKRRRPLLKPIDGNMHLLNIQIFSTIWL